MRLLGVNVQDGFPCFITSAHSADDLAFIERAFAQSIAALQAVGILAPQAGVQPSAASAQALNLPSEVALTEPQTEILLSTQLGPEASACFNESVSVEFAGEVKRELLQAALNDVVARHDALRASIVPDAARMKIAPTRVIELPAFDLQTSRDAKAELAEHIATEAHTPFDLQAGPLLRARFFRLSPDRQVLVLTAHHIVCDGWSLNIIVTELAECYRARRTSTPAQLGEVQAFAAYAQPAANAEQQHEQQEAERYWLAQYASVPPALELPSDRPYPAERTFAGSTRTAFVAAPVLRDLRKASGKQGNTLFSTLLGALQILMGRLSNQSDIVIACPFAGQSTVEDKVLVGHCVQLLPLRSQLDFEASAAEHLKRTHRSVLDALEHQAYTFGTLVRSLKLQPDASRLPLTSLQFNLERLADGMSFDGVAARFSPNPKAFSNFDLFWNVAESADGLRIDCDYNRDILEPGTVDRWLNAYAVLLAELARDMAQPLWQLPLLSNEEQVSLARAFNPTTREVPARARIAELFSAQAKRTPHAVAVIDTAGKLSYSELERASNRLARVIERTVPEHARIAIALERSHQLLVALLAVLKAGRTYVPIDLEHPVERIRQLLDLADTAAILCDSELETGVAPATLTRIRIDNPEHALENDSSLNVRTTTAPAYVIFTSGSTGTPKGVAVGHAALSNCVVSLAERPGFGVADVFIAVTTLSFDIAAAELFVPLISGGRVYIATRDDVRSGLLVERIQQLRATHLQATPTLWRLLLEAGFQSRPGFNMWCGGEPLTRDLADALLTGGGSLWNLYGPTEATIWVSAARVGVGAAPMTIGEPIANTHLHVLDAHDQLCPMGVTGQLCIGGLCLADGYFARPDLTTQAFASIALAGAAPTRLYRTGDLARRLADGSLEVLGRRDQQVKLHGFRLELEEVEHALRRIPG
ncbi:MAG: hypothetical protein RL701_3445, partial [Pseudomonadota bacterium]